MRALKKRIVDWCKFIPLKNNNNKSEVSTMCSAVCYIKDKRIVITHFADKQASLPIRTPANSMHLLSWGRRSAELGQLPVGGWLAQELLDAHHYSQYFPKPVHIAVKKFMEPTVEGHLRWFDVTGGFWIQGMLLQEGQERRVYIVMLQPKLNNTPFTRWPVIVSQ